MEPFFSTRFNRADHDALNPSMRNRRRPSQRPHAAGARADRGRYVAALRPELVGPAHLQIQSFPKNSKLYLSPAGLGAAKVIPIYREGIRR